MAEKIKQIDIDGVTYPLEDEDAVKSIKVGATTTGGPDSAASVVNSGTDQDVVLEFTLPQGPQGDKGDKGDAATIAVDTVYTGRPGTAATVTNIGTSSDAVLSFTIPQGEQGEQGEKGDQGEQGEVGPGATVKIGAVITGAAGTAANVTNVGTDTAAVFNFTIPKGDKGDSGTIEIGEVTTGEPGTEVIVTNVGTKTAAIFDFTIPKGDKGDTSTITVGEVTTGASGSAAKVENVGTDTDAIFNFTIPRGSSGEGLITISYIENIKTLLFTNNGDANFNLEYLPESKTILVTNSDKTEGSAFAIYCEDDNSLTFYMDTSYPQVGSKYSGKAVTEIYTGFESKSYSSDSAIPWYEIRNDIKTVEINNTFSAIKPISTAYWFYGFNNCEEMDLSGLAASHVTSMAAMFRGCSALKELDVSNFDTNAVTSMAQMFYGCENLATLDLSAFSVGNVASIANMFNNCISLTELDLRNWDTSNISAMNAAFYGCVNLKTVYVDVNQFDLSSLSSDTNMFYDCVSIEGGRGTTYDANNITSTMAHGDTTIDPGYFTDGNESEPFAFYSETDDSLNFYYGAAPSVGESYDDKVVTNIYTDFIDTEFTASLSGGKTSDVVWDDVTELVKTVYIDKSFAQVKPKYLDYWFFYFTACTNIEGLEYLDTSETVSLDGTFRNCTNLQSLDLSHFDTSKVTDMAQVFYLSGLTELDIESFDTTSATTMNGMFREMPNLTTLDIAHFDTSKVGAMNAMFRDCPKLEVIYSEDFDTSSMTNDANMFLNCTALVGGNGTTYDSTKVDSSMAHVDIADNPGYFTAI